MKHPLSRCASSPSLAFGGRGTALVARLSRFHGAPGPYACIVGFLGELE
jgi:hypothetical protein